MSDREIMDSKFNSLKDGWAYPDTKVKQELPDARKHQIVSFIKSGLRLVACIVGMVYSVPPAFALLFMAEIVGIYEELV